MSFKPWPIHYPGCALPAPGLSFKLNPLPEDFEVLVIIRPADETFAFSTGARHCTC